MVQAIASLGTSLCGKFIGFAITLAEVQENLILIIFNTMSNIVQPNKIHLLFLLILYFCEEKPCVKINSALKIESGKYYKQCEKYYGSPATAVDSDINLCHAFHHITSFQ